MFFSATGILLNHPDWLVGDQSEPRVATARIAADKIAAAKASSDAGAALGVLASQQADLLGVYTSGDVDGRAALLRFEGAKGMSTVSIDLKTGEMQARVQKADAVTMLNDLHRGKNVGAVWAGVIDISAVLILILSLVGYVLFFSMRFKFRTAMMLTAGSIAVLFGAFIFFVP